MGEPENVRALQRALRDTMTERAGVVRDEAGLRQVLSELDDIEKRMADVGVHPELAGDLDESMRVNPARQNERETVPAVPNEISSLLREVSTAGKLVE
jgi:succinate dehydrogenase flavoprotein subunit